MSANEHQSPNDDDILATLTDEERAAMADLDEDVDTLRAVAGDDDNDNDADDDAPAPAAAPAPSAAAPAAAPAAADTGANPPPDDADPEPTAPRRPYTAELPADIDAREQALDASEEELQAKFDSGEIDSAEYRAQLRVIANDRIRLASARVKAEVAHEMTVQQAQQEWAHAQQVMMRAAAKNDGIDYRNDEARRKELDGFVRMLGNDPANEDKPMQWFLNEAHRRVLALNGKAPAPAAAPAPAPAAADAADAGKAKPGARRNTIEPPASLAQVPGSDGPGDLADEFADIDALEGEELEDAIARMTPAQREKYARGGR